MTPPAKDPDSDEGRTIVFRRRLNAHARHLNHEARNAGNVLFLVAGLIRRFGAQAGDLETALQIQDSARRLVAIVDELCLEASSSNMEPMSTFDKVLHVVGLVAGGIVVAAASGGVAIPGWLLLAAGIVAPIASGSAAVPFKKPPAPKGTP